MFANDAVYGSSVGIVICQNTVSFDDTANFCLCHIADSRPQRQEGPLTLLQNWIDGSLWHIVLKNSKIAASCIFANGAKYRKLSLNLHALIHRRFRFATVEN